MIQTIEAHPKALLLGSNNLRTITKISPIIEKIADKLPIHVAIESGASEKSVIPSIAYLNSFHVDQSVVPATRFYMEDTWF